MDRKEKELAAWGKENRSKMMEKVYSISEVAELLSVSRQTVCKWLSLDESEKALSPPSGWFKLPSGHIRIREWIVLKL